MDQEDQPEWIDWPKNKRWGKNGLTVNVSTAVTMSMFVSYPGLGTIRFVVHLVGIVWAPFQCGRFS